MNRKIARIAGAAIGLVVAAAAAVAALPGDATEGAAARDAAAETTTFEQAGALAELRAAIAGKENEVSEKVYRNIRVLKGVPAGRLLRIMEEGYGRALGVDCTYCHVPGRWDSDEKWEKGITRSMVGMTTEINRRLLPSIQELMEASGEAGPSVNCTTCHRGQVKPALSMDEPAPK